MALEAIPLESSCIPAHPSLGAAELKWKRRACGLGFLALATTGWLSFLTGATKTGVAASPGDEAKAAPAESGSTFRAGGIRYLVKDVDRSIAFYTKHLDFHLELQAGPAFASVSNGDLNLKLSGPKSSGARPFPDGRRQEPGGWNRFILEVDDLPSCVATLKKAGLRFRTDIVTGPGGKQIQLEDPDGNPIELFEPAS